MIEIFCVRHGQAAEGWGENPDPGLSELGIQQARRLAQELTIYKIRHIVSSPMRRTRETAMPAAEQLCLKVQTDYAFREIPTPSHIPMEKRLDWLRACSQCEWKDMEAGLQQWRGRIIHSLLQIKAPTLVFTHFMVLNAVVGHIQGNAKLVNYQPDYCSILRIALDDGKLTLLNLGSQAQSRIL